VTGVDSAGGAREGAGARQGPEREQEQVVAHALDKRRCELSEQPFAS